MILRAEVEPKEILPPVVWEQVRAALCRVMEQYGLSAQVDLSRESELAAYQRFWAWSAEERAKRG